MSYAESRRKWAKAKDGSTLKGQDGHYYELTGNVGLERMMKENITKKVSMSEYLKRVTKQQLYDSL